MGYKIEHLPEHQTIIATYETPFNVAADSTAVAMELMKQLGQTEKDIHFIADFRNVEISFSDLIVGMADAFRNPESPYSNRRLKTYLVGGNELIKLGAKAAAEQQQYGQIAIKIYESRDEAMIEIKTALAS